MFANAMRKNKAINKAFWWLKADKPHKNADAEALEAINIGSSIVCSKEADAIGKKVENVAIGLIFG
jgi:hypothetical protein